MLPEQLLQPRYKVIKSWPDTPYNAGDILTPDFEEPDVWVTNYMGLKSTELHTHPNQWPHLFRPLEWWEERKIEDMPEYIKEVDSLYKIGEVIKVAEWEYCDDDKIWCFRDEKDNSFTWVRGFIPATESEYLEYIKTKA